MSTPEVFARPPAGSGSAAGQAVPPASAPPVLPPGVSSKTWMNIVALIAPFVSFIIPGSNIAGIVFGHLGIRAADRGEAEHRGMGLAGLIISYIVTALWVLAIIGYIVFVVLLVTECDRNPGSGLCGSSSSFD